MSGRSSKTVSAVLLAAGRSTRMGTDDSGTGINKLLVEICGFDPIERCVLAFADHSDEIVIVCSESTEQACVNAARLCSVPVKIVRGGERRQDSVLNGLNSASCEIAAIHDCARCLVTGSIIKSAVDSACENGSGVAAIKVRDTLRAGDTGDTVPREGLYQMQTPQCFNRRMLLNAYESAGEVTDDAAIWRNVYGRVELTEGALINQKLTEKSDLDFFRQIGAGKMRIGFGEDTHRLTEGRKLVLGGIEIPFRLGLLGHSDADALTHAVCDALLGSMALGDIGGHFPDKDPEYKDIYSIELLKHVAALLEKSGARVVNIDAVITAQEPKLAPYIDEMRKKIADAVGVGMEDVGIKATTPEHLGPEGNLECITVRAVACVSSI